MANKKRLIDADELLSKMLRLDEKQKTDVWMTCDIEALLEIQPTVDAVEVVHGRWIDRKIDDFRMWELRCSECDWVGISNYDAYDEPYDFNYCPNCGAKMDGGNEDGNL